MQGEIFALYLDGFPLLVLQQRSTVLLFALTFFQHHSLGQK